MGYVFLSAIIFGLVHPGSKLILGHGIDLLSFCLLYVAIRLCVQIPVVIKTGDFRLKSRAEALTLVSIGIVGALLQMTEFMGIAKGLPVPIVTFLVYTHPVWTLLLGTGINGDKISGTSLAKMTLGISGSAIIAFGHIHETLNANFIQLLPPIFAGFMIALWVCLGSKAKKGGASSWKVSFYYDLFALMALIGIRYSGVMPSMSMGEIGQFLATPGNAMLISGYSILIGLLPNLLFYQGSQSISALSCGLILLMEPLVASLISNVAWNSPLPHFFFAGAGLVFLAGSPLEDLTLSKLLVRPRLNRFAKALSCTVIAIFFPVKTIAATVDKTIHLVEIDPAEQSDYTVEKELKAIDVASDFAFSDFRAHHKNCNVKMKKDLGRGTDEELYHRVETIAKTAKQSEILVGLTRTNFARVAANAAKGSELTAISIGASATNLAQINKRFFSMVSPWTAQWVAIDQELKARNCASRNTIGYFDETDFLSRNFKSSFEREFGKANTKAVSDLASGEKVNDGDCLFVAMNFSQAEEPLSKLAKISRKLTIIGVGDWNYFAPEVKALLKSAAQPWKVFAPTGWTPHVSKSSEEFSNRFQKVMHEDTSPVAAYTYDAVTVALHSLCEGMDPARLTGSSFKKMQLLRDYSGIAESNNFLSQMQIVQF